MDRAAGGHRGRRRERRRARHRARRGRRRAGPDGPHHGHVRLPRDEQRGAGRDPRDVRRGRRRHHRRPVGLRGRAEQRRRHLRLVHRERRARLVPGRGVGARHLRARPAHRGGSGPSRPGRTGWSRWTGSAATGQVLVDHHLSGAIVGLALATRPAEIYRALLEAIGVRDAGHRRIVRRGGSRGHGSWSMAGGLLKNDLLMQIYADVHAPPARRDRLGAGPGAGLGHPRGGGGRRLPGRAGRGAGHGEGPARGLPARPGERRRVRRAVRGVRHVARLLRPGRQRQHAPAARTPGPRARLARR